MRTILLIALVAAGMALENRLDVVSSVYSRLVDSPSVARLEIDSDPNLERLAQSGRKLPDVEAVGGDWHRWQGMIRDAVYRYMGETDRLDQPPGNPGRPQYRILESQQLAGGIERKLIAYASFDGSEIPAYLHEPSNGKRLPAILVIPGHVGEGESGIQQTAGIEASYQHGAARKLAEAGYVTLTPELRGFGFLGKPFDTEHRIVAYNSLMEGKPYKWTILRDLHYAMDLLRSHDLVDEERIGVTGASYGGELSVYYAALDTRVKAVVFQAFGGTIGLRPPVKGDKTKQPHYCHILPGLDTQIRIEEWMWLLAPRPTLGIRGRADRVPDPGAEERYREGWRGQGLVRHFDFLTVDGGHEYFTGPAIEFFKEHL